MSTASQSEALQQIDVAELSINTIRFLAVDAVQKANSGHPGMPMGCAPMAYALWTQFLQHNPKDPKWVNRDRFILSAGHGSMLLYAMLHLTGYDLSLEDIKNFRQWESKTPGHPENFETPGVETTTGPLGQGFANGVGVAIAEKHLAARFNRDSFPIVDHFTYAIVSDGDLMEGISHEAASLAGHLGLGKLIYLYDDNKISIDGSTDLAFTEDVGKRFEAYNWHVQHVEDGNDLQAIANALRQAQAETDRPSIICVRTIIGFGSPNKQGTAASHGSPLGPDEVRLTKQSLGWPEDAFFHVPDDVKSHMGEVVAAGAQTQQRWAELFDQYRAAYPELASQFEAWNEGQLPEGWEDALPDFEVGSKIATRASSGTVLNALAASVENLLGGSADLAGSNKSYQKGKGDFQHATPGGQNMFFGVREHAMASICNGVALHGGLRPYCATFLVFTDYLRPALRLSALMKLPVIYVMTHDSIGLGEDGPTHQPVEHYMALRAIPNIRFIRPSDAHETAESWRTAIENTTGPTILSLTRQGLPTLDRENLGSADGLRKGAYVLRDSDGAPELILIASGSEIPLALEAANQLTDEGISVRVVSMPSWDLFEAQPTAYQDEVLPPEVAKRIAIEAGVTLGWERYVGREGRIIGLDRFGASAPANTLFERFGFSVENIVLQARELVG